MPKIAYVDKRFSPERMEVIDNANIILEEYADQGLVLTLRGLYYRFIARDLFPDSWADPATGSKNNTKSYDKLGTIINDARLAGLVDWHHLEDRTRNLRELQHFAGAADALQKLSGWYHIDFWKRQRFRPEIWVEKDAMVSVIEGVCQELDVPFFSCRGYTSQSEMWAASQRLLRYKKRMQIPYIIHLGDHDPSGIDMSRDIFDRMELFMGGTEFKRIALNMDQVEEYDPPPSPAKITDSRAGAYIREFGDDSWELDALEPAVLNDLIRATIIEVRNEEIYNEDREECDTVQARLKELAAEWNK